jgi:aspartate carbamoyltransferase catalytic subunit
MAEAMGNILSADDFSRAEIEALCERAEMIGLVLDDHKPGGSPFSDYYRGQSCVTYFEEPSTRTRISSEIAAGSILGMHVSSLAGEDASTVKGETYGHTALTLGAMGTNLLVMRVPKEGAVAEAAKMTDTLIVNGGDGANEHPTQMLLDIATARKNLGRIDGTHWVAFGDVGHSRTLNSLIGGLGKFEDVQLTLVASEGLGPSARTIDFLEKNHVSYDVRGDLRSVAKKADVMYGIRTQAERHAGGVVCSDIVLDKDVMDRMHSGAIVMHPGPHGPEITDEAYKHPRAVFAKDQVRMGVLTRAALFDAMLGQSVFGAIMHDQEFGPVYERLMKQASTLQLM